MHLPVELIQEIVRVLSVPEYQLQFGHSPDVLRALCELVQCSRLLHSISTPFLYSSIIISNQHTLVAFLHTSPTVRSHSRALWVRSLPQHLFSAIADLLLVLSPFLRRLALDVPSNHIDHSEPIRHALQRCNHLEEFMRWGYSPMQLFPPPFTFCPGWKFLRRLVLDGPLVDDSFIHAIAQMPHLMQFALIEPRWRYSGDGTEVMTFRNLLNSARYLRRLFLIYCQPADVYLNSLRRLERGVKTVPREGLEVVYTVMRQKAPIPMNLIRDRIAVGTIWELESKCLLKPYCSFLDEAVRTSGGNMVTTSSNTHAVPGSQQIPVRPSHNSY
ncbi:hypothetical protein BDZ94DRAFT_241562 [Collybia nuda]|uniref:Uncharacterized protein n=1 Tax=Collybia nuda TaxID=64659 RepID=A0A9P5Y9H3_9AGAR|nr:hypothetical protein BDZ94DRAFT_241562 [Collybia nuda]